MTTNRKCHDYGHQLLYSFFLLLYIWLVLLTHPSDNKTVSTATITSNQTTATRWCKLIIHMAKTTKPGLKFLPPPGSAYKPNNTLGIVVLSLILLQAGDLETNPGPTDPVQYPCLICSEEVTWECKAMMCDGCEEWLHTHCIGMSSTTYDALIGSSVLWLCKGCGVPNYTPSLCHSAIATHNSFSALSPNSTRTSVSSIESSPGPPLQASSPNKPPYKHQGKSRGIPLTILNVNCQSIKAKKEQMLNLIDAVKPDIIIGTESWLKAGEHSSECLPTDSYSVERRDREKDNNKGGVFIAAKKDLIMVREEELMTDCELLWCKFNLVGSKTLHVGAYYRPHVQDVESLDELETSLSRLEGKTIQPIILAGDFNFPGWDWKNNQVKPGCPYANLHHRFGEILDDKGLSQLVEDPTRKENVLDLIITNNPTLADQVKVVPGISDHDGCAMAKFNLNPSRNKPKPRQIPVYRKANWDSFRLHMEKAGEEIIQLANTSDADSLYNKFVESLQQGIKDHIPSKSPKSRKGLPFMTRSIKRLIRRRDKAYRRKTSARRANKDPQIRRKANKEFADLKREVQKEIRKAYWDHVESIVTPMETDNPYASMKRFWSFIKNMRTDNSGVSALKENGKVLSSPKEKADALNRQFESVFTRENPLDHSTELQQEHPSMPEISFTIPGVEKLLRGLNEHKAAGPDQVAPKVLKELAPTLAPALTTIFTKCYETGETPSLWRHANVAPVFKKGEKSKPSNYRPISLTCICSKLMEHIVTSAIMTHTSENNILYKHQHGFRSKRSCETQLIEFTSEVVNNMQEGFQTDVLIMDFSKAFDKVGHEHLLSKLNHYGINGRTNRWIRSFLADRTQTVVLDDEKSHTGDVISGVPQGSVLGPCLFLIYINDMPNGITSTVRLFADDTIAYLALKSPDDANTLQEDLDKLAEWEVKWQMEFHPEKCQVLQITRNRTRRVNSSYTLHGHTLEVVNSAKYLGINISSDLGWNQQIQNNCKKATNTLNFLKRNLRINSPRLKEKAYKTLVRPHLEYSSSVWDPHTKTNIDKIEMVQRRAARFALNRYRNLSSVGEMLSILNWPTLASRRRNARLTMLYKMINGHVATDHLQFATPVARPNRAAPWYGFHLPYSRTVYHQQSYFPRTIKDWNSLPPDVALAPSLEAFKAQLASYP
jgi:hypothetical protein